MSQNTPEYRSYFPEIELTLIKLKWELQLAILMLIENETPQNWEKKVQKEEEITEKTTELTEALRKLKEQKATK